MSNITDAILITEAIVRLGLQVADWVRDGGLTNAEIEKRLRDPNGVGGDLLRRAQGRQAVGRRFLQRPPKLAGEPSE